MRSVHQQARLLQRIRRRFPTVTQTVTFGRVSFSFTRASDPNRVLDEVAEEEDRREKNNGVRYAEPLHLPYWAELWDSGGGIAQHMADHFDLDLSGLNTLDLGCGQGLAGCVAAALGAHVLFADLEAPALMFARFNAQPISHHIRGRRLNWQKDQLNERFNLIIGADILYERSQWVFLDAFWETHLAPNGTILLGEPGRPTGDAFIEWIQSNNWNLKIFHQPVPTRQNPIRIFELKRD